MSGAREQMQRVRDTRTRVVAEIQELESKLEAAKIRLALLDELLGEEATDPAEGRHRNTKKTVLEIVTEADKAGVTPNEVVETAAQRGKKLKLTSVQSLLSKQKAAGTLSFNGERYYVTGKDPAPEAPRLNVVK